MHLLLIPFLVIFVVPRTHLHPHALPLLPLPFTLHTTLLLPYIRYLRLLPYHLSLPTPSHPVLDQIHLLLSLPSIHPISFTKATTPPYHHLLNHPVCAQWKVTNTKH
uniref:Secreted protein n=1 Tax=Oryza nivara TaxID=4536 RepID=A0A0E0GLN8_ORYNI